MTWMPLLALLFGGTWLSLIDVREHRLPNLGVAAFTAVLIVENLLSQDSHIPWHFASLHVATYVLLYLVSKGQLGLGDVKYALPIGLVAGSYKVNLGALLFITFGFAGIVAALGLASQRLSPTTNIAFGPFMTLGCLTTIILTT